MKVAKQDHLVKRPSYRQLRIYALDPSLATELANMSINQMTLKVPWDDIKTSTKAGENPGLGPVGEYLEVIDIDPASGCAYAPVDLNDPLLLAQDGHAPSQGNPQFHQQMVYAVAMTTIKNFERALGRTAFWSDHRAPKSEDQYVQHLRIYPHAMREANAYYSPDKKALMFGYFEANPADASDVLPGGIVFTCLSHDVIVHETTHALLDGMHRRFLEPSNPDVLAFHEAFADIVALLQHFSFPEVLRHQIAKARGDLASENLLGELAQEFGRAIGLRRALRVALGKKVDGKWQRDKPDPIEIHQKFEPHDRGAILVSTIFDAFIAIYDARIADLLRIATSGTGILPKGELHPDLVNRLANEAAKTARHVLNMCIRALDYCPPVDITFGEYLRALITADYDLVPDDDLGYRVAFVEAFRHRGIYPQDVRNLAVDTLLWAEPSRDEAALYVSIVDKLGTMAREWDLSNDRQDIWDALKDKRAELHESLEKLIKNKPKIQKYLGLDLSQGNGKFEVHSLRPSRRVSPDGDSNIDLVIEIAQQRPGYNDLDVQKRAGDKKHKGRLPPSDFTFRGGCTLLVDIDTKKVRYCVVKRINDERRLAKQRAFQLDGSDASLRATYFGDILASGDHPAREPFAMLHRSGI